jgi:hypothetical protein
MYKIEKAVHDFMENQMGIYVNLRDVEITTHLDFSICLTIDFEEESNEEISVGLMYSADTLQEFVTVFNIRSLNRFKTIAQKELMELYGQGKAYMYCMLDGYHSYSLYLMKQNGKLIAKNDEDEVHEVAGLPETAQQLMDYTQEHYRILNKFKDLQTYQHALINGKNDKEDRGQVGFSIG